jgi:hypothetical protein
MKLSCDYCQMSFETEQEVKEHEKTCGCDKCKCFWSYRDGKINCAANEIKNFCSNERKMSKEE